MSKRRAGLFKRVRTNGAYEWYIDKRVKHFGRLCESTGTSDEAEAERYLAWRLERIREAAIYGTRQRRTFRDAATKYLTDFAWKRSIERDARALKDMDPFIGELWLDCIHNDSFKKYLETRRRGSKDRKPLAAGTLNRHLAVARRILTLAARLWRDEGSNLTWLAQAPLIQLEKKRKARPPYPLDWAEQRLLFGELAGHLQRVALFKVNTGLRMRELCSLRWEWEQRIPELDTPEIKRTVFVLPESVTKNQEARVVVLNDVAQSIVEEARSQHPEFVFTFVNRKGKRVAFTRLTNSGWRAARRRAAARYEEELKKPTPPGFARVRVHDLRHTFGRRLRKAGVGLEDRQDLLGHRSGRMTTHYSAAEIGNLLEAVNRMEKSRESPASTVLRVVAERVSA
jgi:integrase